MKSYEGGCPLKPWTGTAQQSDMHRFMFICETYIGGSFLSHGYIVYAWLSSSLNGPWLTRGLFTNKTGLKSELDAYYFMQVNMIYLEQKYGSKWESYWWPKVTALNMFFVAVHYMLRALSAEASSSSSLSSSSSSSYPRPTCRLTPVRLALTHLSFFTLVSKRAYADIRASRTA